MPIECSNGSFWNKQTNFYVFFSLQLLSTSKEWIFWKKTAIQRFNLNLDLKMVSYFSCKAQNAKSKIIIRMHFFAVVINMRINSKAKYSWMAILRDLILQSSSFHHALFSFKQQINQSGHHFFFLSSAFICISISMRMWIVNRTNHSFEIPMIWPLHRNTKK